MRSESVMPCFERLTVDVDEKLDTGALR